MSSVAIHVKDVAKRYRIGRHEGYHLLRDTIGDALRAPLRIFSRGPSRDTVPNEAVWALDGVSFEIEAGEVVGIIGRNGAGKTTLLKILSRITMPTRGDVEICGRVGALLEVGTGFHGELTGRENIYLNGAVLGMKKAEIDRKFDAIVAFAEVEKFLDTPLKHYSSGMHMRLAFSVAAHLEPEILLVDEVLAVGDASFQRKCLNRIEKVGQQGRTVFFVSHNMHAITRLCHRTILLDRGRVLMDGPSHEVVSAYLRSGLGTTAAREWPDLASAPGDSIVRLKAVRVRTEDGRISAAVDIRKQVGIEVEFEVMEGGRRVVPNLHFFNEEGVYAFVAAEVDSPWHLKPRPPGRHVATAWVPGNFLSEGSYVVGVAISAPNPVVLYCYERDAVAFQVMDTLDGDSARGDYAGPLPGVVRPLLRWTATFEADEGS